MTIDQMNYALTVEKYGSISKAARMLYLSQPHLSKSIQSMEAELCYPIFDRLSHGILPTRNGQVFLNHCRIILQEYRKAALLSQHSHFHRFHLAAGSIYFFMQAFSELCARYQDDPILDLQIFHKNSVDVTESVCLGHSDLGILLVSEESLDEFVSQTTRRGLKALNIHHLDTIISLRQDHPLLAEEPFDMDRLYEYPFVDYARRDVSSILHSETHRFINPDKLILVDERETRHMVVSKTNAFSIGCALSEDILRQYRLTAIPLPLQGFQIVALYRQQTGLTEEGEAYLDILSDILNQTL